MAPNGARRIFVPTNPDLADILGRTDLDFENFHFLDFCWIPNFQISRSQIFKFPDIWSGPALGRAWAGPGRPLGNPGGPSRAGGSLGWAGGPSGEPLLLSAIGGHGWPIVMI